MTSSSTEQLTGSVTPVASYSKIPVLTSYAYLRSTPESIVAELIENPRFEILVDSGGFSAKNAGFEIDLDEYMAWLKRWGKHLFGYVALDKLGDPAASDVNLQKMLGAGLKPLPVHVWGDDQARMDQLFGWSDWVALGGLRRPMRGHAPKTYVKEKMRWASGRNVHWLGYTSEPMLRAFRPFSCDSSNFIAGQRWGRCSIYLGDGRWRDVSSPHGARTTHATLATELASPDVRRALELYNADASRFADPEHWRGAWKVGDQTTRPSGVTIFSFVRYASDFMRRFGVRVFLAIGSADGPRIELAARLLQQQGAIP